MALDLTGIDNVGEFYSHHYLETLLEGDLRATFRAWDAREKDGKGRAPDRGLGGLSGRYFSAVAEASEGRDPEARWRPLRDVHARILQALGYTYAPDLMPLSDETHLPVLLAQSRDGRPWLWVVDAGLPEGEDDSALDLLPLEGQRPAGAETEAALPEGKSWRGLFRDVLFELDPAPRWILFFAGRELLLIERSKWGQGQFLRFDLDTLFGRKEKAALRATVGLLHRDILNPPDGTCLHDTLDDHSHKHAFAVSTDLKHGAREAVELIANEALYYLRHTSKDKVFGLDGMEKDLTREALIYLYRLLFLFYVEARGGEAGVVPMKADAFRLGYSLESLRDLEQVPLTTPQALDGFYIHYSLQKLFTLVNRGFPTDRQLSLHEGEAAQEGQRFAQAGFEVPGVKSALFDPEQTPLLTKAKLRNRVLQRVIERLSLSEPGRRDRSRGRISYAQLGINQLGAVYEGLLSYRGFFAQTDLYEVKDPKDNDHDARAFFVPEGQLDKFSATEVVRDPETEKPVCYPKGSFLFRLAGRDREKSASYYTPEVLTRCLTKYTLKTRLEGLSADEILDLTVLEPAMGSGAFLVEAVSQLADAYLERKQAETGKKVEPNQYQHEKQRVKAYLTANNVYGVDLNPLATELGKISLWLNVLHTGARAPYLDARLAVGNSLIGARRQVFLPDALDPKQKKGARWLDVVPTDVPLGPAEDGAARDELLEGVATRPANSVYHFLLPDEGMVPFDKDKVVKTLAKDEVAALKAWRKQACKPLSPAETARLVSISDRIDKLFVEHVQARARFLEAVQDGASVWPSPEGTKKPFFSEEYGREAYAMHLGDANTAGRRLLAVMDLWCAFWFWPVREAAALPERAEWWDAVEALLQDRGAARGQFSWLAVVERVAGRATFHHWWVRFSEVFVGRGGFDIILGNPPWVKLQWNEGGVLGDYAPELALKRTSAKQYADGRAAVLSNEGARGAYFDDFEELMGAKAFVGARGNEPLLAGIQANLYKVFMTRGIALGGPQGALGVFHQKGMFDDAKGGRLRAALASRLAWHLHFINKLLLFESIEDQKHYEISIVRTGAPQEPRFVQVSNLFHPATLDASLAHDGHGAVPGIKDDEGHWDLRGHRSRVVEVDAQALALFASLFDEPGTPPEQARLPIVHSAEVVGALRKLALAPRKLADLEGQYFATVCFDETGRVKDGTIKRETRFPKDASEWVVSGPHFYVATPFAKTPNEGCRHNQDYSVVDLESIPEDYLPRTNYVPACEPAEYRARTPSWDGRPANDYYRHVHREMVSPTGERTLVPSIIPPGPAHINTVFAVGFRENYALARLSAAASSLIVDFLVKTTGKGHVNDSLTNTFPIVGDTAAGQGAIARCLRLNCASRYFSDLWSEVWPSLRPTTHTWSSTDPRLKSWADCKTAWEYGSGLRTQFDRRYALVELDALVALDLGLTLDELLTIYRVQFPVLQQYERETFYDQKGRIVFTVNKGLPGVGLSRAEWNQVKDAQAGEPMPDFAAKYVPPFDRCDREEDMTRAYRFFRPLLDGKPAGSPVTDLTPPPPPPRGEA